jgi:hypothetical protein
LYCYACRKAGPDIAGKTEFVTGKKFRRESLVYHNKTKSGQFRNQLVQPFIFSEKICEKVLFTTNSGHLQALKVCDLKVFMSESIAR